MNRDDIIRMAKQASGSEWSIFQDFMPELERFAALVAAAERETVNAAVEQLNRLSDKYRQQGDIFGDSIRTAVAAEREACARMAEECVNIERLADDIRARGE